MSAIHRRGLRVDDPLAAGEEARDEHGATSLVVGSVGVGGDRLRDIPLARIHANPAQPRKRFDESALASLADSIRERGVLQPVIVRPAGDEYELVAGERRWRAAELAGEETIPALVDGALDEAGSLELALIENVVREDLTAIELARTLAVLLGDLRMTGAVVAKRLGRSRADIVNTVRLLDLPDEAIDLIDSGALSKGHGKALLAEPDHHRRRVLARRAAEGGWSVRALEAEITPRHQAGGAASFAASGPVRRGRQAAGRDRQRNRVRSARDAAPARLSDHPRPGRRRPPRADPRRGYDGAMTRSRRPIAERWRGCSTWNTRPGSAAQSAAQSAARCAAPGVAPAPASTRDWWGERSRLPALHEVVRVVGISHSGLSVMTGAGATVKAMAGSCSSIRSKVR